MTHRSVIFMGTPEFAVPVLRALHENRFDIRLVVTQPDRPSGRGRVLTAPPVKQAAGELGLSVFQPLKIRAPQCAARLRELSPDFFVVVAFGQILSAEVLAIPNLGPVNVHASLLPKYRGPAPIQWALLRGETQTGVTTMLMNSGVDTGDILLCARTDIAPDDTTATLQHRLSRMGARLLIETLQALPQGELSPEPQNHAEATYAPLLKKEDGRINWDQPAERLHAFIRAMNPWPGAYCFWESRRLKILKAKAVAGHGTHISPGMVIEGFPDELRVAAAEGFLLIDELQGTSGKRMAAKDFLRGHAIAPGTRLT